MYENAESALASVLADTERAQARAVAAVRFRAEVEATTASASSPDRTVTATVDSSGLVTDLRITDRAMNRRGQDLARLVRETVYAAQREVANRVNSLAAETFGADAPATHRMRDELSLRFVEPEPDGGSLQLRGLR